MMQIQFPDKMVTYDTFINDLATRITAMMKADAKNNLPPKISQREAFRLFDQGNVLRWRRQGKIEPCKRPGKVEYDTARLIELHNTVQDYF